MRIRIVAVCLPTLLAIFMGAGCGKSSSDSAVLPTNAPVVARVEPAPPVVSQAPVILARIHWLGTKQIAADTNSAYIQTIWNLPETTRLKNQTLDKLALALVSSNLCLSSNPRLPAPAAIAQLTNFSSFVAQDKLASFLRPLLDDLVQEEWYLEIQQAPNQPTEAALALRLSPAQSTNWQNCEAKLNAEPGSADSGSARLPIGFHVSRTGDWTVLGLEPNAASNSVTASLTARLQRDGAPDSPRGTNWIEAKLDPRLVIALAGSNFTAALSPIPSDLTVSAIGDGSNVRVRGLVGFNTSLPIEIEPWNVPTNLIGQPLSSFTAIRGFRPWLSAQALWKGLQWGPPPNEFYGWSLQAFVTEGFFAIPDSDASNRVARITDLVMEKGAALFAKDATARFGRAKNFNGFEWQGFPHLVPFVQSCLVGTNNLVFGGLGPLGDVVGPLPTQLKEELNQTNLVAYQWELSAPRTDRLCYISQFFRMAFRRDQLPGNSAGLLWLRAAGPRLGVCATELKLGDQQHLSVLRKATLGLSAMELHALADWLESPNFPSGFRTVLVPQPPE